MYTDISNKFTAYTDSSLVRRPKSKIEVGGVTYTGETALISYPKISHSAERMIGVFPSKTCELEILNRYGDISLNGKEVTIYRGLEIDGETEWVPMDIFSATDDNIKNELTKRTIRFKGTDRSSLFDTQFVNDIEYPCTVRNFVEYICERHGVSLETASFPFAERTLLSAPNVDSSISERELIARIAELGGCIAQISREGGLRISQPYATGKTVKKKYYKTVSKEPKFGEIKAVTLGHQSYTDDIVYPEKETESDVMWRIDDNPFVDGALADSKGESATRETLIADIASNIIGKSIIPFSVTDFVDDYIVDLGDTVTVEEKDGSTFETVILNISTSSRIKSVIGAATQTAGSTNFTLAGSTKQMLKKVALEVDRQAGVIRGIVEDADGMRTTIEALSEKIDLKFEDLTDPDHLDIEHVTSISAEGVKIYNGKIQIFDKSNKMIFGTDEKGSLGVTGNINVKFKSGNGDTATLKISNEDYEDTDYATASIKVSNNSGTVFSNISMWEVDGVGVTSITSDNISLSNEDGNVSIALSDKGTQIMGDTEVFGDLETYGNIYSNGVFTTKADRLEGCRHIRNSSDVYGLFKSGVGKVSLSKNVNFDSNNLASESKTIDGFAYYAITFKENQLLYQLSSLRSVAGINSVDLKFTAGKYGWARYYFAYTTSNDGTLNKGEMLVDLFSTDKNHITFNGNVSIPSNAAQWCVIVEADTASPAYYAGWRNVTIRENKFPTPTMALELQDAEELVTCRLDCFSSDGTAYVALQGRNSIGTSKRLELGSDTLYWGGSIACSSEESVKTNIVSASSVLDKICNAGIYSYNYISEDTDNAGTGDIVLNGGAPETTEQSLHYGLVIGEGYNTPEEVITSDGKHIDLYSMIALAWKAIQDLAEKIDTEVKNNA